MGGSVETRRVRAASVREGRVLCHDELIRDAKGVADVVDHGGYQGAAHNAAGDGGGERDPQRRAEVTARRR